MYIYALPNKDFQVLRRRERSACHHVDDVLIALWEGGLPIIVVCGTDGGVRMDDEGARVGLPLATSKV